MPVVVLHVDFWQVGAEQFASERQPTHTCLPVSQRGVAPPQSVLARHCTHLSCEVSHFGVAPVHAVGFACVHCSHEPASPPVVSHAVPLGLPAHSASPAHARHTSAEHTGFGLAHCAFDVHCTQMSCVVSHTDGAGQVALDVHCTHCPALGFPGGAHTPLVQSAFDAHARQVFVVASQIGVPPEQSAFPRQPTHLSLVVSLFGVAPVHAAGFASVHGSHWPLSAAQRGTGPR